MGGYYSNGNYHGFIPSIGKYMQFETEKAYMDYLKEVEGV